MERTMTIVCVTLVVALVATLGYFSAFNPAVAKRTALAAEINAITPVDVKFEKPQYDIERWQQAIAGKPTLWRELVEPPPPPAPPPPKPKEPPNLEAMAKDVSFGRQGIGNKKVKMFKGGDPKGAFVAVGDTVNGLTVKEISKSEVVLSLSWEGQELTYSIARK